MHAESLAACLAPYTFPKPSERIRRQSKTGLPDGLFSNQKSQFG
jgi:hypothetical protein